MKQVQEITPTVITELGVPSMAARMNRCQTPEIELG